MEFIKGVDKDAQKLIDKFYENHPDRKIVFLIKAGSHFFDLNTPSSDKDFRGIYMPSAKEIYKGEARRKFVEYKSNPGNKKNVKNSNTDVDFNLFSITMFFDLLKRGDFNMMEMLHSPKDKILIDSPLMVELRDIRKNLLVNDISAFVGFIKKEYRRYGINIYHYSAQEKFLTFLNKYDGHIRLKEIWKDIKEYGKDESLVSFTTSLTGNNTIIPTIKLAQRMYQNTVKIDYIKDALKDRLERHGHRQRNMAASGVEFKGLYHALRLIYEANDLYDYGEFKLPFDKERHSMLLKIKTSDIDQDFLFNLIDNEIEKLYNIEKTVVSNKEQVSHLIDKLLFKIHGQKKIEHIVRGNNDYFDQIIRDVAD